MCITRSTTDETVTPLQTPFSLLDFPSEIITKILMFLSPEDRSRISFAHEKLKEVELTTGHRIFSIVHVGFENGLPLKMDDSKIVAFDTACREFSFDLEDDDVTPATLRAFFKGSATQELRVKGVRTKKAEGKLQAALACLQFQTIQAFLNASSVRILTDLAKTRASLGEVRIWWDKELKDEGKAREMLLTLPRMEKFTINGQAGLIDDGILLKIVENVAESANFCCNADAVTPAALVDAFQMVSRSPVNKVVRCVASWQTEGQFLQRLVSTLRELQTDTASLRNAIDRTGYEYGSLQMHSSKKIRSD